MDQWLVGSSTNDRWGAAQLGEQWVAAFGERLTWSKGSCRS